VSALASLTLIGAAPLKSSHFVKPDVALQIFLNNLPVREDYDEAKICSAGLCDLCENGVIPLDFRCGELYRIIGETLALIEADEDLATQETIARFAGILFRMYQEIPRDRSEAAFSALSVDAQGAVQKVTAQYAHQFGNVVTP